MKNKKLTIIFFLLLSFFILPPQKTNASELVKYTSTCSNADSALNEFLIDTEKKNVDSPYSEISTKHTTPPWGGKYIDFVAATKHFQKSGVKKSMSNFYLSKRGIALPSGVSKIENIYIYFHGRDWWEHTPQEIYNEYSIGNVADSLNSAIIFPQNLNIGGSLQAPSTAEQKCLLNEAIKKLEEQSIDHSTANIIVTGHSAGGNFVEKFILRNQTAGKKILASIFFDASYGQWAQTAAGHFNSGPIFIYYADGDSQSSKKGALETHQMFPQKVKTLAVSSIHADIPKDCFADHKTAYNLTDGCNGKGQVPAGTTNPFANINASLAKDLATPAGATGGSSAITSVTVNTGIPLVNKIELSLQKPNPQIDIPGLGFSDIVESIEDGNTYIYIPSLGEYIAAIYRYSVVVASILAVIMIIISGLQWSISGGSPEKIKSAQKRIAQSIIGLTIAILSYAVLSIINPELINFRALRVLTVQNKPLLDYIESESNAQIYNSQYIAPTFNFTGGTEGVTDPRKKSKTCLVDTFAPGLQIGQEIRESTFTEKITFMNETPPYITFRSKMRVHKAAVPYYKKAFSEIISDPDPEVAGWLKWMKDYEDGLAPALNGSFLKPGDKVTSVNLRPLGSNYDTHALGLAVDIMYHSNWYITLPEYKGTHGKPALDYIGSDGKKHSGYCTKYKATLEKMKSGYYESNGKTTVPLASDPYNMYARLDKKLANCFNNFDNGKDPYTSIPQRVVDIFAKNGIYWGGYGWTRPGKPIIKSDSMHFEFVGPCLKNP